MIRRAPGILLLDPDGELLSAASREMRLRREAAFFATTEQEALAWRRRRGSIAVVVAPASLAGGVMKATASRPAPVLVTYGPGGASGGAFRSVASPVTAAALVAAVDEALALASMQREHRRTAVVLRRTQRQLRALRLAQAGTTERVRTLAGANVRLREIASGLVRLLAVVSEHGDPDLAGHGERTARVAAALGRRMGMAPGEIDDLRLAATLHDVGRFSDPPDSEATGHAERGARMLESLPFSQAVIDGVRWHHERYDGRGNLSGLSGTGIPRIARIVALADAFVELVRGDGLSEALGPDEAMQALRATASRVHDPDAVEALERLVMERDEPCRLGLSARELAGANR